MVEIPVVVDAFEVVEIVLAGVHLKYTSENVLDFAFGVTNSSGGTISS